MSEDQRRILESTLWDIANALRGRMNADEYRNYILGFIFYKYLSDKLIIAADKAMESDGVKFLELIQENASSEEFLEALKEPMILELGYFLTPEELFCNVAVRDGFILDDLSKILRNIEKSTMGYESEEEFDKLFEDLDLNSSKLGKTADARNSTIQSILKSLNKIDFNINDPKSDVLGDSYEYLIARFASDAGKKAGEFYTPQEVSTVIAKIVTSRKKKLKDVYDPTCGSGSLLLRVAREATVGMFYGQELNPTTYNLARMNMILHGVHYKNFDIKQDDVLESPMHMGKQMEAVVANPPFSAKWGANPLHLNDDRFSRYGKLAPSSKADFAFVQHMLHHLADNGIMAIVLPHGVLFRGASEGVIRRYIIENMNVLDAVIGLPANLFYGTSIPACILVFKKCREADDVLFIDASKDFEKVNTQNKLRYEDVEKITSTYIERKETDKYSRRVSLQEIADNDFNLNIPRYIDTFEEEEQIDLNAVAKELQSVDKELAKVNKEIAKFCKELGIPAPF